ncbi:MAG: phosphoribosylglycinamide formyltransferase [Bacteroidales bacterium]|nr:phosphoribosylglycinamide formyltransferase [Bacteroidales bacterium]
MKKIVVFASGSGTNFQNIANYFDKKQTAKIELLISNKADAYALERAKKMNISTLLIDREMLYKSENVLNILREINPDLLILAGFLWLIPENIIEAFPQKIVNIHPALLPKYGGKGMYGMQVHKAVVANKETETGISIHYVTKEYDKGDLIFQATCEVLPKDSPETIAEKVHSLEYEFFPKIIEKLLLEIET